MTNLQNICVAYVGNDSGQYISHNTPGLHSLVQVSGRGGGCRSAAAILLLTTDGDMEICRKTDYMYFLKPLLCIK